MLEIRMCEPALAARLHLRATGFRGGIVKGVKFVEVGFDDDAEGTGDVFVEGETMTTMSAMGVNR